MLLQNVRLSFPNLFKAAAFSADQEPKFSAMFILEPGHPQIPEVQQAIEALVRAKWPKGAPKSLIVGLRPNTEKEELDGFEKGGYFFNANKKTRPTLIDRARNPVSEEDGVIYAGCYVNAIVDFWVQDNQYGKRVNAGLSGVQFARDGDAFGGGAAASPDDFPELEEGPAAGFTPAAEAPQEPPTKEVSGSLFG